ncbi:MAG TPA: GNAT family N-acetyltransferase [Candidatus Stackebrandtia faecavium]|nr:GNAT family N-acetyltransferase [Candidatus Stackebrandtia faecavium]
MSYVIRPAEHADIARIVDFEVDIAIISFGDDAITDRSVHERRVTSSLGKNGEVTLVADDGDVVGWAWLSRRTNSLTGARYGNFRSLAVSQHPSRGEIGEALLDEVITRCRADGIGELVGKVHADNLGMRALYRKFEFEPVHLTMRKRIDAEPQ